MAAQNPAHGRRRKRRGRGRTRSDRSGLKDRKCLKTKPPVRSCPLRSNTFRVFRWPRWDSNPHTFWVLDFESSASAIPPLGRADTRIDPAPSDGKRRRPAVVDSARKKLAGCLPWIVAQSIHSCHPATSWTCRLRANGESVRRGRRNTPGRGRTATHGQNSEHGLPAVPNRCVTIFPREGEVLRSGPA